MKNPISISKKKVPLYLLILALITLPVIIIYTQRQQSLIQYASSLDTARLEAENGNSSGPVQIITNANASGGKAILLNATSSNPTTPTPGSNTSKVNWSTGYYVGWQQGAYPPETIPWKAITHLNHFSLMSSNKRDGSIDIQHGLTPAYMTAAVTEAHRNNVKILIAIGGAEDNNFDAACNPTNRDKFINNLVNIMITYGYDGIDLDIEQDFNHTDYIACVQQLRNTLDTITPRPIITMAADPDWQAYMAVKVAQYVDQINLMSYWTDVNGISAKLNNYTNLGIPKNKLGIGLGLGNDGGIDTNTTNCNAKTKYSVDNGYGGVMEWIITDDQMLHNGQTPCLDAVANYVPIH